jgi:TIR domain-containing protein
MALEAATFEAEELWEDLLAFIEEGRVIPVVGAELLTVEDGGAPVGLYRAVAERLLKKYGFSAVDLRRHHELNDAVSALAAAGRRVQDLYRPINDILRALLADQKEPLPVLRELASIPRFDLFATTTADDLLARTLDAVRFAGAPQTDQIEYAPGLSSDRLRDIPEMRSSGYTAVFYLFGKASASPLYAIHDEDTLEFVHSLQAGRGNVPERLFSELRGRNLLLIGCNFADWLGRFFIRLSNSSRLSSGDRVKKEFLVDDREARDPRLTFFLERFSQNTRVYPGDARGFVSELSRRWSERHPATGLTAQAPDASPIPGSSAGGTIFISYSSADIGAARKLFAALQDIGGDVAWFDKSALRPGDDWEQHILGAIQRCGLFLPLLSANTEQRSEGYFRREWDEAAERSRRIQGRKFIFPVAIDPDYSGDMGRYGLVPERFRAFQYSHAPGGELGDALKGELVEQLRALRRARTS